MADQNFNQGPPKNVEVRTMASDLNSIQTGGAPQSYTPPTPQPETPKVPEMPPQKPPAPPQDFNFQIPQVPMDTIPPSGQPSMTVPPQKKGKGLLGGLIAFLIVIALGAIGYFIVYPMFATNKNQGAAPVTTSTPQTANGNESSTGIQTVTTEPSGAATSTTSSGPASTTTPPPVVHISLFQTTDASVTSTGLLTPNNLQGFNLTTAKEPALVEVVPQDKNSNPLSLTSMLQSLLSMDFTQSGLDSAFNPANASEFVYVDSSGNRSLGFVAELSSSSSLVDEKATWSQIFEANTNLKNFWVADPGTEGAWKSGDATSSNRYVLFSKNGYGIDYGWKGNVLVISSSYDGYKAALQDLQ